MNVMKCPRLRLDANPFRLLRHSVLMRDGWRCQSCASRVGLEVHITLCRDCHRQIHSK
jgi:hypothetical protein